MADYLTRLAERTLGLAPVVQPVIAPMYAPGPPAVDEPFEVTAESQEPAPLLSTPGAPASSAVSGTPAPPRIAIPAENQAMAIGEPMPLPGHITSTPFIAQPQATASELPAPIMQRDVRFQAVETTIAERSVVGETLSLSTPNISHAGRPSEARRAESLRPLSFEPPPVGAAASLNPAPPTSNAALPQPVAETRLMPVHAPPSPVVAAREPRLGVQELSPMPHISVTIGRIEVRAIAPAPAASSRPVPPSPKMSLDDYLRGRNGEKR